MLKDESTRGARWVAATAGLAAALLAPGNRLSAELPATEGQRELWIEVLDAAGAVVEAPLELEVLEGERSYTPLALGQVGDGWRVVLYFDQLLADPIDFHNATLELADHARELVRLGTVEIVLAGYDVRTALPPTRDADALAQALAWLRLRENPENEQENLRRELVRSLGLEDEGKAGTGLAAAVLDAEESIAEVEAVLAREAELLRDHRERLLSWAVDHSSPSPQALFLIGSGFDARPSQFHRSLLVELGHSEQATILGEPAVVPSVEELGRVLAAYGWVTLPLVPASRGDLLVAGAPEEGEPSRGGPDPTDVILRDGKEVDRRALGFDPRKLLRRRQAEETEPRAVLFDRRAPLDLLAESSGGEVLTGSLQLPDLLSRLPRRRRLAYRLEAGTSAGWRALQVSASRLDGTSEVLTVRAPAWASAVTPEVVAAIRARRFLADEIDEGALPIAAAVETGEDQDGALLVVQLEGPWTERQEVRVTVAAPDAEDRLEISHETQVVEPLPRQESVDFESRILELRLDQRPEAPVVVLVEELDSRRWGAAFASDVAAGGSLAAAVDPGSLLLPAPKVVHLMSPRVAFAMGETTLETVVSESRVARVDFMLDGERQAAVSAPPYQATLDLGPLPRPRRVDVVAYDGQGTEIGRDYLVLNEGSGIFGVRIVEPQPNEVNRSSGPIVGPVDVEAEVEPRRGEGVDRVEFFWKETLVATRYAPPYRQRVVIPGDSPKGFIRVVAYLEDGASSEDVVFINSPGPSERLQVNLMELYVVVTDRRGRPVTGLTKEDFRVTEGGERQKIATFSNAGDLPLTVGLAIDSSASMFVKLPQVQFAAAEYLRGLSARRDRAFVVGFGNEPRLARNTTSDLPRAIHALRGLEPEGQTAIWKAIVYSLVQLQGVPGKKALIVYSDGADEDPDFSFRTCLRFARKVGVPIYVILSNNEIVRTQGRGLSVRSFLGRLETLVDAVGGRAFMTRVGADLEAVYRQIDEELRSQYLVGYYSADRGGREWRPVEVDVRRAGLKARTIAGYFR